MFVSFLYVFVATHVFFLPYVRDEAMPYEMSLLKKEETA